MIISVILTILKIIGIVLLCILGLALLLILSVLFVPLRYRFEGSFDKVLYAKAKVSWFLHIISFSFTYKDNAADTKLKVFGIPLSFLSKKESDGTPKEKRQKKKGKTIEDSLSKESIINEEPNTENKTITTAKENVSKETVKKDVPPQTVNIKKKKSLWDKIKFYFQKIRNFIIGLINKLKNIKENITYYIELLESDKTKAAFSTCRYRFSKLFHHIIPKKFQIHVSYGLEDPATTAKILAVHSMFYAYIGNFIFLHPDFEEQKLQVYTKGKGRITSAVLGYHFLRVYFDKNCREFISKLKKESSDE